ncbi:MAG TPA: nitrilase-related carbon-nitrogen hydrolase, partial [Solirubrobacterales bacterium]|nr:nitrilase-related carbon-nitrogen hydrolase [Solirubrobacterales bacterium]
ACVEAVEQAVEDASGAPSLLVLPELGATERVLKAVKTKLAQTPKAPALTVVGMYHQQNLERPDFEGLAGDGEIADYVNEAVVLGPTGSELWRHRKLSCAQGRVSAKPGAAEVTEDICLGTELGVVDTPLGWLTVVICLDSFAPHSRQRLATSPASVLLVPSLSPRVLRHRDSLQHLVQELWAAAFVCNRAPQGPAPAIWSAPKTRSFWTASKEILVVPAIRAEDRPAFVFQLREHQRRNTSPEEPRD